MAYTLESFVDSYNLSEEDINKHITLGHLEAVSRSFCGKWRSLPAHLELDSIVIESINRMQLAEDEKKSKFFKTWRELKGPAATYKVLIRALLKIKCIADAESVCNLLMMNGEYHNVANYYKCIIL